MRKMSLAKLLIDTGLMLGGLKNHGETLGRRGIDAEFLARFAGLRDRALNLNAEQEALKARLEEKTAELEIVLEELDRQRSEAKKVVKLDLPRTHWVEFGFNDKR